MGFCEYRIRFPYDATVEFSEWLRESVSPDDYYFDIKLGNRLSDDQVIFRYEEDMVASILKFNTERIVMKYHNDNQFNT